MTGSRDRDVRCRSVRGRSNAGHANAKEKQRLAGNAPEFPQHCIGDERISSLYMPRVMERVLLVSGDFVQTGGMDMPNFAVAHYLAERGVSVQLVAFRVADELAGHTNVHWTRVPKPLRS